MSRIPTKPPMPPIILEPPKPPIPLEPPIPKIEEGPSYPSGSGRRGGRTEDGLGAAANEGGIEDALVAAATEGGSCPREEPRAGALTGGLERIEGDETEEGGDPTGGEAAEAEEES